MRYYRTTGLTFTQMQELVRRVNEALEEPWNKRTGRPKSLRLYKAVEAACIYLRQNATQEFIGETRDTSQPTISRYAAVLVPLVKAVLEEFVPDAAEAIEIVKGRVVLVDGTLAPCWSYAKHPELWNGKHKTTGLNAQLIFLSSTGTAVWISDPLPGKTHDAKSFTDTGAAQIVEKSSGGFGDKGYQGTGLVTPKKKPEGGELTMSGRRQGSAGQAAARARTGPRDREHPRTLTVRHELASFTGEAGDPAAARDLFAALAPALERVHGPEHPHTLSERHELARWTGLAGDPAAARDLIAELLPVEERVLGPGASGHPDHPRRACPLYRVGGRCGRRQGSARRGTARSGASTRAGTPIHLG